MKTYITFFALLLCFTASSQSLTEELGGVKCNFEFYSDTNKLDVIKQILIKRSTAKSDHSDYENESYGYGYAYSDWRIEFVSTTMIGSRKSTLFDDRMYRGRYQLVLKNQAGGVLLNQYLYSNKVRAWTGKIHTGAIYTYSIDLYGLPVVLLDNVAVVEIVLID